MPTVVPTVVPTTVVPTVVPTTVVPTVVPTTVGTRVGTRVGTTSCHARAETGCCCTWGNPPAAEGCPKHCRCKTCPPLPEAPREANVSFLLEGSRFQNCPGSCPPLNSSNSSNSSHWSHSSNSSNWGGEPLAPTEIGGRKTVSIERIRNGGRTCKTKKR
jgi:hypothetical protein